MSALSVNVIDAGYKPTANYPRPVLVQDGSRGLLYFTGRRTQGAEEERVVAVFSGCLGSRFGYPNDEALAGHPLHKHGLAYYGVFEVAGSPWMAEVKHQNRECFPNYTMPDRRHIIITLHDEIFECLVKDFQIRPAHEVSAKEMLPNFNQME